MTIALYALAFLALVAVALCIQQAIRLIRWAKDLVETHEALGDPGET